MHPTIEALREYARLGMVLDGEIQRHLDACASCAALYRGELGKAGESRDDRDGPQSGASAKTASAPLATGKNTRRRE